jgi:hypothetical protein
MGSDGLPPNIRKLYCFSAAQRLIGFYLPGADRIYLRFDRSSHQASGASQRQIK